MTWYVDALPALLAEGPVVLLVRHAERGHIDDPTTGHEVPLTDAGREGAESLGRAIATAMGAAGRVVVAHSPVPRCAQTAEMIERGASATVRTANLGPRGHLGGPYLLRSKEALELMRDVGSSFMRRWLDGALPSDLLMPADEAARAQVEAALGAAPDEAAVTVLVTHDLNTMLVRDRVFGVRHEDAGWIDYLDGVVLGPRRRMAWYREHSRALPPGPLTPPG